MMMTMTRTSLPNLHRTSNLKTNLKVKISLQKKFLNFQMKDLINLEPLRLMKFFLILKEKKVKKKSMTTFWKPKKKKMKIMHNFITWWMKMILVTKKTKNFSMKKKKSREMLICYRTLENNWKEKISRIIENIINIVLLYEFK
jgi:hypothetical protein